MRFPDRTGALVTYKRKDLIYDCKNTLLSVPSDDEDEDSDDEHKEETKDIDIDDVPFLGVNSTKVVLPSPTSLDPSDQFVRVYYSQCDCDTALGWGDEWVEPMLPTPVIRVNNATYGTPSDWGAASITMYSPSTIVDELEHKAQLFSVVHEGFEDAHEGPTYEISKVYSGLQRVEPCPSTRELRYYQNDGTFKAANGLRLKSFHICQIESDVRQAELQQVKESLDYVIQVPKGCKQAFNAECFGPYWATAVYKELVGLYKMGCFVLEKKSHPDVKATRCLPSHFVFAAKWTSDIPPKFKTFKARLVASGNFEEDTGIPFDNYSPAATSITNRFFDAFCTLNGFNIRSTDMVQAFLNSVAKQNLFVDLPKEIGRPGYCMRLLKMLYGLRASPKCWMETLTAELHKLGFITFPDDPSLLIRVQKYTDALGKKQQSIILVCAYVDDIKWGTNDDQALQTVIDELRQVFDITDEESMSTYLGLRYTRTIVNGKMELRVDQTAYIHTLLKRFDLEHVTMDNRRYHTPLPSSNGNTLEDIMGTINADEAEWASKHKYSCIVGSLIHAMVHTRPDIAYAVSLLSRAMSCPKPYHYKAARYVLLYLRRTSHLGLVYRQVQLEANFALGVIITASVDSSFADCHQTARSTAGFIIWFCGAPMEWECKRQALVTMSTMESEYVAASRCVNAIKANLKYLEFVRLHMDGPATIYEDNEACIAVADNPSPIHRSRTRHIALRYHNVRDAVRDNIVKLVHVWTKHQVADIFTKSLSRTDFERFRGPLMGEVTFTKMCEDFPKDPDNLTKVSTLHSIKRNFSLKNEPGGFLDVFNQMCACKDT